MNIKIENNAIIIDLYPLLIESLPREASTCNFEATLILDGNSPAIKIASISFASFLEKFPVI